jgi:hypothetical protein
MLGALKAIIAGPWESGRIRPNQPVAGSESVRPLVKARVRHGTPYEHGMAWVRHAQASVNPDDFGLVLFEDAMELYLGMLDERGWAPRSWNPVAREIDLICTGGTKPYAWIITRGGKKARRRIYPIPRAHGEAVRAGSSRRAACAQKERPGEGA